MASRFVPVTDERIFVLNEAVVLPNRKSHKLLSNCMYRGVFLMNKNDKIAESV
jgi:hypothetical protein